MEYKQIGASECAATVGCRRISPHAREITIAIGVFPPQVTLIGYGLALPSWNGR